MQVSNHNNVKIYSITSASRSAIPDWLVRKNKAKLKQDQAWRNRIELIQDFEFPEASLKIKSTRDGGYIMATGVYQPQMKVFDLAQMAMKFDRHAECENVQFEILSDDWTKSVHLQSDRSIEFHTQFGLHYKTRVPKFGRDMSYHYPTCDLLVVGACEEVFRLNLEQGRFMPSLQTQLPSINASHISPAHSLFGFGGSNGIVEFWDPRIRNRLASLDVAGYLRRAVDGQLLEGVPEITSMRFHTDGLTLACGTSTGQVVLYDLRRSTPLLLKDHQYGYPIKSLCFHDSGNVLSADTKIVKVWDRNGDNVCSIESPYDINDMLVERDSGLVMLANEGVQIQSYYIPSLGPAPKWCPFLDNLTEELEEAPASMYDDYKFVARKELAALGLDQFVGTNLLKAYMHGFFVDMRLYEKARAIANPFEFEEHKKRIVQQRIDEQRQSRISAVKKLPKVNKTLAAKLMKEGASESEDDSDVNKKMKKKQKKNKKSVSGVSEANPLGDGRFAAMFQDADFQVDETSHEYLLHHPSERVKPGDTSKVKNFEPVIEEEESNDLYDAPDPEGNASDSSTDSDNAIRFTKHKKTKKSVSKPQFYELKTGLNVNEINKKMPQATKTFGERVSEQHTHGGREIGSTMNDGFVVSRDQYGNQSATFKVAKKTNSSSRRHGRSFGKK